MAANQILDKLLTKLNITGLQKKDQPLYDVLKDLIGGTKQIDTNLTVLNNTVTATGITGSGTIGSVAQFTNVTAIGDVTAAGISAALDLL